MIKNKEIPLTTHKDVITPMLTDFYQISMSYSYFITKRQDQEASFELIFRKCPFNGQYAIFAGLHEIIQFIAHFKFPLEHIEYLKTQLPNYKPEFFKWLASLDCSKLKLFAMEEGSFVFPREPLVRLQGPIGLLQILETPLLNIISFATLMATNAARMKHEAGEKAILLEFGLRRAQGPDGGLMASQYAYLGGFHATSNVLAGFKFGIPISGTMAHSFITSYNSLDQIEEFEINGIKIKETTLKYRQELGPFCECFPQIFVNSDQFLNGQQNIDKIWEETRDSELGAFLDYARTMPNSFLCLVDTYDTIQSGVPNFITVSLALIKAGVQPIGIRLDSGDLANLSIQSRRLFDEAFEKYKLAQIKNFKIAASNDINQDTLKEINKKNYDFIKRMINQLNILIGPLYNSIDIYGIGTNLVTCQKQSALGGIYQLIDLEGTPKHKLSQEVEKSTLPGRKVVYRVWKNNERYPIADLIAKEDENIDVGQTLTAVNINNGNERFQIIVSKVQKMTILIWNNGQLQTTFHSLKEFREFCEQQKQNFNPQVLNDKFKYPVLSTLAYYKFIQECNEMIVVSQQL